MAWFLMLWPFQIGNTYNFINLIEDGIRAKSVIGRFFFFSKNLATVAWKKQVLSPYNDKLKLV